MANEARSEYNRKWHEANREAVREYRERTKEQRNARRRERYATCPEYRQKALSSAKNTTRRPDIRRANKYGLTIDAVELMENEGCNICRAHPSLDATVQLKIDHDHRTGDVRGILCHRCNVTLGHVHDDPILLSKMMDYLMRST